MDSSRTKEQQRAYLERRNALWHRLRLLEPGGEGAEDAIRELAQWTGQTRAEIERGLGWLEPEK